jgi:peptide/nickel transport system permease protein
VGAEPTNGGTGPTSRQLAWARRRRALGGFWRAFRRDRIGMIGLVVLVLFVAMALFAPLLADASGLSEATVQGLPFERPSLRYPLGTDEFGRSVLTLLIWGSRISLLVGLLATVGAMTIGSAVGIAGGYYGGRSDSILNALTNWFLVIPWIPLAIVLAASLSPGLLTVSIVIAVTSWAPTARLVRAQVLSVKERPYVERARSLGAGNWHLMTRHVLPNVFPIILANTVVTIAVAILSETTLAILGLGDPNSTSWGTIIEGAFAQGAITIGAWWYLLPPGIAISLVVLSFMLVANALDEVVNPRLRRR